MKKNKIIYTLTTGVISLMMLFSAYQYLNSPQIKDAFIHLGFPGYFRIELALAKIAGVAVLLIPQIPSRIKEWAYAGFGITFVSAFIAHFSSGDPVANILTPLVFLVILIVSNVYFHKVNKAKRIKMDVENIKMAV
jgi:DoxX-like family